MKNVLMLWAAVAALTLGSCGTTGIGAGDTVPRWQAKAIALIDLADPAIDRIEARDSEGDHAEEIATARAALVGLRQLGTARVSLDQLEGLLPVFREVLVAQGMDLDDVEDRVFYARSLIGAVRVALA